MLRRVIFASIAVLAAHVGAAAQQPTPPPATPAVVSPTPAETLAKWPWSITTQAAPFRQETVTIALGPKEGMEYKYRLEKGAGMLYSWTATSALNYELHSVP